MDRFCLVAVFSKKIAYVFHGTEGWKGELFRQKVLESFYGKSRGGMNV